MKKFALGVMGLVMMVSAATLLMTGCEEAEGLEIIAVSPASKEMTTRENSVWLTASFPGATRSSKASGDGTNDTSTVDAFGNPVDPDDILHLPLTWKVTNPALGQIYASSGTSALYVRNAGLGVNRVIVRDQYDNEGYATIEQKVEQYRLELVAVSGTSSNNSSAAYIPVGQVTATIRVNSAIGGEGPTAPFTWSVVYPTRGYILAGQGSDTIVFRKTSANETGFNVIQCTDAYGVTGTIVVQIGEAGDDEGPAGGGAVDSSLSLAANPAVIDNGDNTSVVTITTTSTPNYSWSVVPEDAGNTADFQESVTTGLSQVTVQTSGDGEYTVSVTDGASRSGQITITQE